MNLCLWYFFATAIWFKFGCKRGNPRSNRTYKDTEGVIKKSSHRIWRSFFQSSFHSHPLCRHALFGILWIIRIFSSISIWVSVLRYTMIGSIESYKHLISKETLCCLQRRFTVNQRIKRSVLCTCYVVKRWNLLALLFIHTHIIATPQNTRIDSLFWRLNLLVQCLS